MAEDGINNLGVKADKESSQVSNSTELEEPSGSPNPGICLEGYGFIQTSG